MNNFNYSYSAREFAELINSASMTLLIEKDAANGEKLERIKFRYYDTPEKHERSLSLLLSKTISEIGDGLSDLYYKLDKLNYLSRHLIDIQSLSMLFKIDESGNIEHVNFSFSNLSEDESDQKVTYGQECIQQYLSTALRYQKKAENFLIEMKRNIEVIAQQDIPLPVDMLPKSFTSTITQPEKFFDYLIHWQGLDNMKTNFIPTADDADYYEQVSYDAETETKVVGYWDPNEQEFETTTTKFADLLLNKLYAEYYITVDLIDQHVNSCKTEDEIKLFLKILVGRLRFLLAYGDKKEAVKKYDNIRNAIKAIVRYIFDKYGAFCPKQDEVIKKIVDASKLFSSEQPEIKFIPQSTSPTMFNWKSPNPDALTLPLHTMLNKNFIADIDHLTFAQIFSGGSPDRPIGIRWIDKPSNNSIINKVTLLYLFKLLSENDLIEPDFESPEMMRKIAFIFSDSQGGRIENLHQSKKNVKTTKTTTHRKKELEEIVEHLTATAAKINGRIPSP